MPISGGSETGTMRRTTTTNDRTDYFTLCACIWGNYGGTHLNLDQHYIHTQALFCTLSVAELAFNTQI